MIWSLRSLAQWAEFAAGIADKQDPEFAFAPEAFDIGALPIRKIKAHPRPRDTRELARSVVHVTAVRGGFGVRRARVEHWRKPSTPIPEEILRQLPPGGRESWARRLALWERFRDVPYHTVGLRNGDVIVNRRLSQRSYHAGKGNDGAGCAFDCAPDEDLTDFTIATFRAALRLHCKRVLEASQVRPHLLAPHRAFTKQRRRDTSATIWREVVRPVIDTIPEVLIDYQIKRGSGRPVPNTWDDDALFDAKGRPL